MHDVFSGITTPPSLGPNTVIGCIKWDRSMGLPIGNLVNAFRINSYHWRKQGIGDRSTFFISPHPPVEKIEGTHDASYYRVMFWTVSEEAEGFEDELPPHIDPRRYINVLDIAMNPDVVWPNNVFTGAGHKIIAPATLDYHLPGEPQRLPDFQVFHHPLSVHP